MEQLVFVRTEGPERFIAQAVHHPTIKAEGRTEEEALERLRLALMQRLGVPDVVCKKLFVADPAKPATYDLLADLYAGAGQGDYASFYYGEALGIDPSDAAATRGTAELARNGNQRAAEAATPVK